MGGVKNLQVVEPTFNTLKVSWDPAVGNVRTYKVFYTAEPNGQTEMVGGVTTFSGGGFTVMGRSHAHVSLDRRRCREAPPAPP